MPAASSCVLLHFEVRQILYNLASTKMNPIVTALMIPFLGTALGSAFVFFMKRDMPDMLQKVLLGFASGVMVAATSILGIMPYMLAFAAGAMLDVVL